MSPNKMTVQKYKQWIQPRICLANDRPEPGTEPRRDYEKQRAVALAG